MILRLRFALFIALGWLCDVIGRMRGPVSVREWSRLDGMLDPHRLED